MEAQLQQKAAAVGKDSTDVYRILRTVSTDTLASRYTLLLDDAVSREVALASSIYLKELFGTDGGRGIELTVQNLGGLAIDEATTRVSLLALAGRLLASIDRVHSKAQANIHSPT